MSNWQEQQKQVATGVTDGSAKQGYGEPAFHGFMDKNDCCVHICYTPWAAGGPNNELPTAYYTTPQQPKVDKHTDDLCQVLIQKTHIQERQIAELQAQLVAQPKQEPVAYMWPTMDSFTSAEDVGLIPNWTDYYTVPLYTTPQQRTWVGLTDERRVELAVFNGWGQATVSATLDLAKAIEAELKEKNT